MTALKPYYNRSYALVIGINSYADPRFVTLGEAEADAAAVAKLLAAAPHGYQVQPLLGEQATRPAIQNALHDLRATDANDRILVYFAGHGFSRTDRLGNEFGLMAPFDTQLDRDHPALEISGITGLRQFAGAKHIGFIFDACFSGAALGLTRSPQRMASAKFLTRRAYQAISAGAGDQTVTDYNSMTDLLVEQLHEDNLKRTGLYTLSDLGLYLRRTMARDSGQTQIPQFGHLRGSEGGEFVFFMETEGRLPTEVESALYAANHYVRQGAVAALIALAKSGDEEKAQLAREWLERLAIADLHPEVRKAAHSYFEEENALQLGDQQKLVEARRKQEEAAGVLESFREKPGMQAVARVRDEALATHTDPPPVITPGGIQIEPPPTRSRETVMGRALLKTVPSRPSPVAAAPRQRGLNDVLLPLFMAAALVTVLLAVGLAVIFGTAYARQSGGQGELLPPVQETIEGQH
ncbi:MAG: caspase family protein [Anaerolineae bacterium]